MSTRHLDWYGSVFVRAEVEDVETRPSTALRATLRVRGFDLPEDPPKVETSALSTSPQAVVLVIVDGLGYIVGDGGRDVPLQMDTAARPK